MPYSKASDVKNKKSYAGPSGDPGKRSEDRGQRSVLHDPSALWAQLDWSRDHRFHVALAASTPPDQVSLVVVASDPDSMTCPCK